MSEKINLDALWKRVNMELRKGEIDRSLWEAAEVARPLTLDGDTLVLGLKPVDMPRAGYLTTPAKRARILAVLERLLGKRLELLVIEGQTVEAYEAYKRRLALAAAQETAAARARMERKTAASIWETVSSELHQLYTKLQVRRFPSELAELLRQALPLIAEAEKQARQLEPDAEQLHFTQLNRAFDRLATYTDVPAAVVALEYLRYQESQAQASR